MTRTVVVAAVQATPVFLDRDATVERLVASVEEAAGAGAQLVVFPEAIVPGYPDFVWRVPAWSDGAWFKRLWNESVDVPGPVTDALGAAARRTGTWIAVGVNEKVRSGTLYNSLVYIGPDGQVAGVHRKLMPTGGERTVWGNGPAHRPTVIDMGFARVGGLICWENLMPLARAAVYEEGVDLHLAPTWDNSDAWVSTLRHIAREGRVFVVGTNTCLHGRDIPRSLPGADVLYPGDDGDWLSKGNAAIVGPDGDVLAGPLVGQPGILVASLDLDELVTARRQFDPVGHYSRPDVFRLNVGAEPGPPERETIPAASMLAPDASGALAEGAG